MLGINGTKFLTHSQSKVCPPDAYDSGGPDAHEEKLDNDPIYKKKWDDHVERINNEETAFRLAGEWITDYDKKNP